MPSKSHLNIRFPVMALAAVAVSFLAFVGCSGDDDGNDGNREASTTSDYVVDGNTGNAADNKSYRGVELTIENRFNANIVVSLAGYCRKQITGTDGFVTLRNGEKARWRSCDKIIYGRGKDYSTEQFSALAGWPGPTRERFSVLNPAGTTPKFYFGLDECFNSTGDNDFIGGMRQNTTVRAENKEANCGVAVVVTRQADSTDYIRFYAVVEPQS